MIPKRTTVFLSGPMTGLPDFNRKEFRRIEKELKKLYPHWIILNPAILPEGLEHHEYMKICTAMVKVADQVIALPGWEKSKGAIHEKKIAKVRLKTWDEAKNKWPGFFK